MRKLLLPLLLLALCYFGNSQLKAQQNVGIGTTSPNPNAILHLDPSSPLGFLMPKLSADDTVTFGNNPANTGIIYYDTTAQAFRYFDGTYWTLVGTGAGGAGTDGKTVLNGTINPTPGDGVDGDFFINTTTYNIFGPKTAGVWGAGTQLIGPAGADGLDGDRYATTSTTTLTIALGPQSLTVDTALAYTAAQTVIIAESGTNFMEGTVTTYNASTGALDVNVTSITGAGIFSSWTVNLAGAPGPAGADGNTILSGLIDPTPGDGVDGDFFINTTSDSIFGPKTAGVWGTGTSLVGPAGAAGTNGIDGNTILSGLIDPTPGDGVDGDFFINTTTDSIFGPKTAGVWGTGTSLVGPTGAAGANGIDGNTILSGLIDPTPGDGVDDDFYINTTTDSIFGPKTAGVWGTGTSLVGPTGAAGTNGIDGNTILSGLIDPTPGDGVDGDFFINTTTDSIFGPKTAGVWGTGTSLVGQTGAAGANGIDGNTILSGLIDPTPGDGVDGDFFINTTTDSIFGPKTAGVWGTGTSLVGPAGAAGTNGLDGNTILSGLIDPTPGDGVDGDFFIKTTSDSIFGPKTAGVWGIGTSLVGPAGAAGTDGADGDRYATTSTTTLTIALGPQSLTVDTALAYTAAQTVIIAESGTNFMEGTVTTYNPSTGALDVNVTSITGGGTFSSWTVNLAGAPGPAGADGNTILSGLIDPTPGDGVDGDFYINTTSDSIFGPKTAGVWGIGTSLVGPAGAAGTNGIDGNTILSGLIDPTPGDGVDGDFFINTTTDSIFGPKTAGVWGTGTSLVGPAGAAGTNGIDGNTILSGLIDPTPGDGVDGDFFINTTSDSIFGPKTAGVWGTGTSLVGPTGAAGANGIDGNTILSGLIDPTPGDGVDGDFFINTTTDSIFGPKTAGVWGTGTSLVGPTGAAGANGIDGNTILSGLIDPTPGDGVDGDFFINTTTDSIFGPKTAGVWGTGTSLVGPTGAAGANGIDGNTILSGLIDPTPGDGVDGDFFINTTTDSIFGPKTAGVWGTGTSLVGPAGAAGTNGIDGNTILSGLIDPTPGDGVDGDFFINTTTDSIFGPKTAGVWGTGTSLVGPTGAAGANGIDGNTILSGLIDPTPGDGVDGDFFINTTTDSIFGPKTAGVWGTGTSLVGPTGAAGANGIDGNTILSGLIDPTPGDGVDGDFFINTTTDSIFGPKAAGVWGTGTSLVGPAGADGNTVLNGLIDPTPGDGVDGDFYINTVSDSIFGPKTAGVWPTGEPLVRPGGANDTIPANVFSARIAANGTVISQSYPFVNSVNNTGPGVYDVDYIPGFFSETPAVSIGSGHQNTVGFTVANYFSESKDSVIVVTQNKFGTNESFAFDLLVQRQGVDYQNSLTAPPNVIGYWQRNGSDIYVDTVNNVGIGTNTPANKLEVIGDAAKFDSVIIVNGAQNGYVLTSNATGEASWQPGASAHTLQAAYDGGQTINMGSGNIDFISSGANSVLYLDEANERVGIGNTSPANPLDVLNTTSASAINAVTNFNAARNEGINSLVSGSASENFGISGRGIGGTLSIGVNGEASNASSSNIGVRGVGFNTINTGWIVGVQGEVQGITTATNAFGVNAVATATGATNNYGVYSTASGGTNNYAAYFADGDVVAQNGNVGIGTITPANRLEVIGDAAKFDSVIIVNGAQNGYVLTSNATGEASWQSLPASTAWDLLGNAGTIDGTNFIGSTDNVPLTFRVNNTRVGRLTTASATFIGFNAGASLIGDGGGAVGFGYEALTTATSAGGNTAIGHQSLRLTTGSTNTALGIRAGEINTTGAGNTFIGSNTAATNVTGSQLTLLGNSSDVSVDALTNATAIGANSVVSQSNSLVLGNNANVGIGTSTPANRLEVIGDAAKFDSVIIVNGAQNGYVLTSNATGEASWQPGASAHTLQAAYDGGQTINMGSGNIDFISSGANSVLYIDEANERVGIGNSSPVNKLDVDGAMVIGGNYAGTNTAPVSGLLVEGNVGIGTTAANAPLQFAAATANRKIVLFEGANNDHQFFGFGVNPSIMRYQINGTSSHHVFYAGANSTTSNELMRIEGTGDVGIGIINPSSRLHVIDNVNTGEFVGRFINTNTGSQDGAAIYATSTATAVNFGYGVIAEGNYLGVDALGAAGGFAGLRAQSRGAVTAIEVLGDPGSTSGIHVDANGATYSGLFENGDISLQGNVGAGGFVLQEIVNSNADGQTSLDFVNDANRMEIRYEGSNFVNNSFIIYDDDDGEARLIVDDVTGDVAIGDYSPDEKLDVTDSVPAGWVATQVENLAADGIASFDLLTDVGYYGISTDGSSVGGGLDGDFYVANYNLGSTPLVITDADNVGIGTITPTNKLEVVGDAAKFDSVIIVNGAQTGYVLTSNATGEASWQPLGASTFWDLTGNAGTVDGTNYLGTNDDVPLNFRMNNQPSGRIDDATTGVTSFGYQAGNNGAGFNNSAFGYRAMALNTADGNTALGALALENNNTADANTGIGYAALRNIIGTQNTALGNAAMENSASGNDNVAIGFTSLLNNNADGNVAVGSRAALNSNGQGNTAIGYQALDANTTGTFNIAIGHDADVGSPGLSNAIAIGLNAIVDQSNSMVLGDTSNISVGIGTSAPQTNLHIEEDFVNVRLKSRRSNTSASTLIEFGRDNGAGGFVETGSVGTPGSGDFVRLASPNAVFLNAGFSDRLTINSIGTITLPDFAGSGRRILTVNNTGGVGAIDLADSINWARNGTDIYNTNTGNVGIGTTTPAQNLTVSSTGATGILVEAANNAFISLDAGSNTNSSNVNFRLIGSTVGRIRYAHNATPTSEEMQFQVNGVDRMIIDGNGNIAVGNSPLAVVRNYNYIEPGNSTVTTGISNSNFYNGASSKFGTVNFISNDGTGEKFGSSSIVNGNVGSAFSVFGTNNTVDHPGNGNVYGTRSIVSKASAVNGFVYGDYIEMDNDGNFDGYMYYGSSIGSGGGTQYGIYLTGEDENYFSGEVGIGVINPAYDLDVNGTINATTYLYSGSELISTNGSNGFFAGLNAGHTNQPGFSTHIGNDAGATSTGISNTFVGYQAGFDNTTGSQNAFFGIRAGENNIDGTSNTFIGRSAGDLNTSGNENTFLGRDAGDANTTGIRNTILGRSADVLSNNLTNATAIGYSALVGASNALVLGGTGGNAVNVGIGLTAPVNTLDVLGEVAIGTNYAGFFAAPTDGLIVEGRVGIGTNAPSDILHVSSTAIGVARFESTSNPLITIYDNGTYEGYIQSFNDDMVFGTAPASSGSVQLYAGGSNRLTVENTGDVGIGTTNPLDELHVQSTSLNTTTVGTMLRLQNSANNVGSFAGIRFVINTNTAGGNGKGAIYYQSTDVDGRGDIIFAQNDIAGSSNAFPANEVMVIKNSGNVGINESFPNSELHIDGAASDGQASFRVQTAGSSDLVVQDDGTVTINTPTDQAYDLYVSGSAAKSTGTTWINFSDKRLKDIEGEYTDGLELIRKINPIWFKYNGKGGIDPSTKPQVGIVAQDIQKVAPYTISKVKTKLDSTDKKETEVLSFDFNAINYAQINAIKELADQIDQLKIELEAKNTEIENLKQAKNAVSRNEFEDLKAKNLELEAKLQKVIDLMGTEVRNK
ncbi:MAG: tail fiber domain-containing protein [Cytophagales bacterium]